MIGTYFLLVLNRRPNAGSFTNHNYIVNISPVIPFCWWSSWMLPLSINNELVVIPDGKEWCHIRVQQNHWIMQNVGNHVTVLFWVGGEGGWWQTVLCFWCSIELWLSTFFGLVMFVSYICSVLFWYILKKLPLLFYKLYLILLMIKAKLNSFENLEFLR